MGCYLGWAYIRFVSTKVNPTLYSKPCEVAGAKPATQLTATTLAQSHIPWAGKRGFPAHGTLLNPRQVRFSAIRGMLWGPPRSGRVSDIHPSGGAPADGFVMKGLRHCQCGAGAESAAATNLTPAPGAALKHHPIHTCIATSSSK